MRESTFRRLPCKEKIEQTSLLIQNQNPISSTTAVEYFLEKDISCFRSVVYFYNNGGLHVPKNVCMNVFMQEMLFWGIDLCHLSPCCALEYAKFSRGRFIDHFIKIILYYNDIDFLWLISPSDLS